MCATQLRILVVEDYPANQVVMTRFLEPYGDVDLAETLGADVVFNCARRDLGISSGSQQHT